MINRLRGHTFPVCTALALLVLGCREAGAPVPRATEPVQLRRAVEADQPSSAEAEAQSRFLKRFSPAQAAVFREILSDPRQRLELPNDPQAQALLNDFYAARQQRFAARPRDGVVFARQASKATLALVPVLDARDPNVQAIVLRAQGVSQEDVILLAERDARPEYLAAALQVLNRAGDSADRLSKQRKIPLRSIASGLRMEGDAAYIVSVQQAPKRLIPGVGNVQAIDLR